MAAIWTYVSGTRSPGSALLPYSTQGSVSMTTGSYQTPIAWLDVKKGEPIINGTISTIWDSNPQQCTSVTHTVFPPLPTGISVFDDTAIAGIIVTGASTSMLTTSISNNYTDIHANEALVNNNNLPPNSMLTHYLPLSTKYIDYTISVTVIWEHDNGNVGSDTADWILRMWNSWDQEEQDVKGIVIVEIK